MVNLKREQSTSNYLSIPRRSTTRSTLSRTRIWMQWKRKIKPCGPRKLPRRYRRHKKCVTSGRKEEVGNQRGFKKAQSVVNESAHFVIPVEVDCGSQKRKILFIVCYASLIIVNYKQAIVCTYDRPCSRRDSRKWNLL